MDHDKPSKATAGSVMIIGGHEDRSNGKEILARFVELAGGAGSHIVVLTAATREPDKMWEVYDAALDELGARHRSHVQIDSHAQANDAALAARLAGANGIFITGGDQKRLMAIIGDSAAAAAMHDALFERGACIAGTSAGASAISAQMVTDGKVELQPEKGAVGVAPGLGLLRGLIIDQHFSQRHRLNRLLGVVAQHPDLFGIGMDENTALVVRYGIGIDVIGSGAATILDAHHAASNVAGLPEGATPELLGIRLHLLPAGSAFPCKEGPPALQGFLDVVCEREKR